MVASRRDFGPPSPPHLYCYTYTPSPTSSNSAFIMADMSTQDAGMVLADDLMRDRARQFVEFLDDDVGDNIHFWFGGLTGRLKRITTTERISSGC